MTDQKHVNEESAERERALAEKAWDGGFMAALLLRDVGLPARNPYLPDQPPTEPPLA